MSYRDEDYRTYGGVNFTEHSGEDFSDYSKKDLKKIWRATLNKGIHGICFSMYEDGQKPGDTITAEQVERRIEILKPYTKWIRSFSCIEGNEHIPKLAHMHGLNTLVGAWLSDDLEKNEEEIEGLIRLGKKGTVDIAAVGNEVLYREELTLDQLLEYMKRVKEALPNIPIGYVDAYYEFSKHPELVEYSDVILSNCYPYWEGCHIDGAFAHMQQMFGQASDAGKGKKVIITETGWPNKGGNIKGAESSEENAIKYFINAQRWSKKHNIDMFYFSSFDESWKTGEEGDVGACWGLWDKYERLKF
ncbi:glycoside hydrolase family 17 protein [Winogradskyella ursingii]|uniref:glycoside hydrolase family 17 protein n=1 Tax=Winogradskyella ursingii TaxID=2686079 RepID=UPI001FEB4F0C|nr:glycosyl hydrolase family 17 protein [Winogradskyella ursingii]